MYRLDSCPECGQLNNTYWDSKEEVIFYRCGCGYSGLIRILNKNVT